MAMTETTTTNSSFGTRIRDSFALAQTRIHTVEERAKAQWGGIPANLRHALDRVFARVREALDLPSRSEIAGLAERLDQLDRKLVELERARAGQPAQLPAAIAAAEQAAQAAAGVAEQVSSTRVAVPAAAAKPDIEPKAEASSAAKPVAKSVSPEVQAKQARQQGKGNSKSTKTVKPTSAGKTVKARPEPARDAAADRRDKIREAARRTTPPRK